MRFIQGFFSLADSDFVVVFAVSPPITIREPEREQYVCIWAWAMCRIFFPASLFHSVHLISMKYF